MTLIAAIDTAALWKVVWVSVVAGSGVTLAFTGAIYGSSRAAECRREVRDGALVFTGVAVACSVLVLVALVAGFVAMTGN